MSYLLHQLKKSTPLHSSTLIYTDKYCNKYLHYVTLFTFSVLSTYISHRQVHYIFVTASVSLRAVFLFLFFFLFVLINYSPTVQGSLQSVTPITWCWQVGQQTEWVALTQITAERQRFASQSFMLLKTWVLKVWSQVEYHDQKSRTKPERIYTL